MEKLFKIKILFDFLFNCSGGSIRFYISLTPFDPYILQLEKKEKSLYTHGRKFMVKGIARKSYQHHTMLTINWMTKNKCKNLSTIYQPIVEERHLFVECHNVYEPMPKSRPG